mmetsp:Transcript_30906/g.73654  ORF Transcript_30906/g.73654 Transcript_30906/m.73654 type:complete len:424 (+) Transcript_30906:229-1500(+)
MISSDLPVIIAGAGPGGLVAALSLKRSGVPFVIYDRASSVRLCSNAGSGIDMAPVAINILEKELEMSPEGIDRAMRPYEYMYMFDAGGQKLNTYRLKDMKLKIGSRDFGFANRSDLQHALLEELGLKDKNGKIVDGGSLHCGIAVASYENKPGFVEVVLGTGEKVRGLALLACDGIHSAVRKHMHRGSDDSLHYCGQVAWWGKTVVEKGSELEKELKKMQKKNAMEDGNVSLAMMGTRKKPGTFFSCEVAENVHAWVYVLKDKNPPAANASNDLTRRGGVALSGVDKQKEMNKLVASCPPVVEHIMTHASVDNVTRAGFFDRANLSLPYVDGRTALLGDAAHPQSPMMGQGANMAIVDGFVAAQRLAAAIAKPGDASPAIERALADYDCDTRRKDNRTVIKKARKYGRWSTTKNVSLFQFWTP